MRSLPSKAQTNSGTHDRLDRHVIQDRLKTKSRCTISKGKHSISRLRDTSSYNGHRNSIDPSTKAQDPAGRVDPPSQSSQPSRVSTRERNPRKLTKVSRLGDVGSMTTSNLSDDKSISNYQVYINMVAADLIHTDVPKSYKEALQSVDKEFWIAAIERELKAIKSSGTFTIVDKPTHAHIQTGKFIFKKKYDGNLEYYKARLIVHGYRQEMGTDYWETYAPVSSSVSTRVFLTMCATFAMEVHQMDIDTAFLNAELKEDIFMSPPHGMNVPMGKVLKLHKCLYDLIQSPRNYDQHLSKHFKLKWA